MTVITEVYYNGDGTTTNFSFPFDYIDQTHVKVGILNDTTGVYDEKEQDDATYGWSLANSSTVQFNSAPPAPTNAEIPNIKIFRETDSDSAYAVFSPGAPVKAVDLNDNFEQSIYIAQESATVSARAESVVTDVEALAIQTKIIADQAAADSSAAVSTANAAETTANTALSTANTAQTTANTALTTSNDAIQQATTANDNATTANVNATAAMQAAQQAETDAAQAVSDASSALTLATTADGNATSALALATTADSNATTALTQSNTAITDSAAAVSTANAAADAVSQAVLFEQVANVAAIPGSPSDQDAVTVVDSTGIESFNPLTGLPAGFVGDSGLNVKILYNATGVTWEYISYDANDPDDRYVNPTDALEFLQRDGSVAMNSGASLELDPSGSGGFFFGGAGGKMVKQNNGVKVLNGNTLDELWRITPSEMRVAPVANLNGGAAVTGNITVTGTVDGRDVSGDGTKLDGIEANATGDQTASEILTLLLTVDGTGSGLDADKLDGKNGSHYLNYNNATNKPDIPANLSDLNDDINVAATTDPISTFNNDVGYITGIQDGSVTPEKLSFDTVEYNTKGTTNYNFNNDTLRWGTTEVFRSVGSSSFYLAYGFSSIYVDNGTRVRLGTGTQAFHSNFGYLNQQGQTGLNAGVQTFDMSLQADGRIRALQFDAKSDRRLKRDVAPIAEEDALRFVNEVRPKSYYWKDGRDSALQNGYIAQEVAGAGFVNMLGFDESNSVEGELIDSVTGVPNPTDGYFSMQYNQVPALLHVALKTALDRIAELERRLNDLNA
ncbi:tail fiber protein [Synechococcus phage P60]|uniref:Tail fiber n=1 Tax=Synechococcus phage P60 TaxID=2905923 RepID=L0CQ12_9CAUD|nr:tail fiber protein [Synechococcus phage P60]AGA17894.1 tail fiber [Synechococcus phage P60]